MRNPEKLAALIDRFTGRPYDAHYLGYLECFNQQMYFEAHEVLEVLWLRERGRPEELFYKGLIQLAGAFVHLQKNRSGPAAALFRLARQNLCQYPQYHQQLDLAAVLATIDAWSQHLSDHTDATPLFRPEHAPILLLGGQAFVLPR